MLSNNLANVSFVLQHFPFVQVKWNDKKKILERNITHVTFVVQHFHIFKTVNHKSRHTWEILCKYDICCASLSYSCEAYNEGTCPCHKYQQSDTHSNVWGEIRMYTATHVVFDDLEVRHTTCRLFFDRQDSPCTGHSGWLGDDKGKHWWRYVWVEMYYL